MILLIMLLYWENRRIVEIEELISKYRKLSQNIVFWGKNGVRFLEEDRCNIRHLNKSHTLIDM